jgi:2-polyprenyl-3-methyl-5-hydroxy-6-metoxy-1,4-benzoquinol methylase
MRHGALAWFVRACLRGAADAMKVERSSGAECDLFSPTVMSASAISDLAMYAEKADAYFDFARTDIAPVLPREMSRVLEIGCGAGATMKWLRTRHDVRYAVGIEVMPNMAKRAEAVFDVVLSGNIETMELPGGELPGGELPGGEPAAGRFDAIIALDVLEHLVDPWSVVRRLHGLLQPDGVLIASIPNISHYSVSSALVLRGRWNYANEGLLDRTHLRFFTRQTAVDLLTCSGLVPDKVVSVRRGPKFSSARARWYSLKVLSWILPEHLLDWQFLVRVKAA